MTKTFKQLRMQASLDTRTAAEMLEISLSLLYKIEQGYRVPSRDLIHKMSKIYNCSTDQIFLVINITSGDKGGLVMWLLL